MTAISFSSWALREEHKKEMKAIRDEFDPNGGRAIGAREMLYSKVAESGGEMLYINKSKEQVGFSSNWIDRQQLTRLF